MDVVVGGCGVWCVRRVAPRPPRAYPACLLRSHAPLSLGAKGAVDAARPPLWIPAFAGMTVGGGGNDVWLAGMTWVGQSGGA